MVDRVTAVKSLSALCSPGVLRSNLCAFQRLHQRSKTAEVRHTIAWLGVFAGHSPLGTSYFRCALARPKLIAFQREGFSRFTAGRLLTISKLSSGQVGPCVACCGGDGKVRPHGDSLVLIQKRVPPSPPSEVSYASLLPSRVPLISLQLPVRVVS